MNLLKFGPLFLFCVGTFACAQTPVPTPLPRASAAAPVPSMPPSFAAPATSAGAPLNPFARPVPANKQGNANRLSLPEMGDPGNTTLQLPPPMQLPPVEDPVEEIPAIKIGIVNGVAIYKGTNIYHFEENSKSKIVRKIVLPKNRDTFMSGLAAAKTALTPLGLPVGLPSMVGAPQSLPVPVNPSPAVSTTSLTVPTSSSSAKSTSSSSQPSGTSFPKF